jgi:hypothetical protein
MSYIGSTPTTQSFISGTDYFNGTGSQTAFTLSRTVASVNDIQAVVNNVVQVPNDAYNISGTTITFTSAPSAGTGNVYVRYLSTTTQSITPSQNTVSYATWDNDLRSETFAFKNRIINGDMVIDQRNNGAAINFVAGTFPVDRMRLSTNGGSATATAQQNLNSITPPAGFTNYIGMSVTSGVAATGDQSYRITQRIEGYNVADLGFGTANASTVTLSFWVRASIAGTYGGSLQNSAGNRFYVFSYTINAANTWEYKTATIPGDTTGTWLNTNGMGIMLLFSIGTGSTLQGAAGSWGSTPADTVTGQTNLIGTTGATFYLTGLQLEKGTTATNFDVLPYGTELNLCQRYCYVSVGTNCFVAGAAEASDRVYIKYVLPAMPRATPTLSFSGTIVISDQYITDFAATSPTTTAPNVADISGRVRIGGFSGLTTGRWYGGAPNVSGQSIFNMEL